MVGFQQNKHQLELLFLVRVLSFFRFDNASLRHYMLPQASFQATVHMIGAIARDTPTYEVYDTFDTRTYFR